jgi:hypothetical protein
MKNSSRPAHLNRETRPVIAVRVPAPLHRRIQKEAKRAGVPMSELMASLINSAFEWQAVFGERAQMRDEIRRVENEAVEATLRRKNWKKDQEGRWAPPEVHGFEAGGFKSNAEIEADARFQPSQVDPDTVARMQADIAEIRDMVEAAMKPKPIKRRA